MEKRQYALRLSRCLSYRPKFATSSSLWCCPSFSILHAPSGGRYFPNSLRFFYKVHYQSWFRKSLSSPSLCVLFHLLQLSSSWRLRGNGAPENPSEHNDTGHEVSTFFCILFFNTLRSFSISQLLEDGEEPRLRPKWGLLFGRLTKFAGLSSKDTRSLCHFLSSLTFSSLSYLWLSFFSVTFNFIIYMHSDPIRCLPLIKYQLWSAMDK